MGDVLVPFVTTRLVVAVAEFVLAHVARVVDGGLITYGLRSKQQVVGSMLRERWSLWILLIDVGRLGFAT